MFLEALPIERQCLTECLLHRFQKKGIYWSESRYFAVVHLRMPYCVLFSYLSYLHTTCVISLALCDSTYDVWQQMNKKRYAAVCLYLLRKCAFHTIDLQTHNALNMHKYTTIHHFVTETLQWRYNEHDGVSNHQPSDCLVMRLFRCRSKKTSKLRVTGLFDGNWWPVNSPHKWPVTWKMFPFVDVFMFGSLRRQAIGSCCNAYVIFMIPYLPLGNKIEQDLCRRYGRHHI